jgi:hypothetical protein
MSTVLFPRKGDRVRAHSLFFQAGIVRDTRIGVINGMTCTRASAGSVTVADGNYLYNNAIVAFVTQTLLGIPYASSGMHRYDAIVFDCSDITLKRLAGVEGYASPVATDFLENNLPAPPELGNSRQILLSVIKVTQSGITTESNGHYCTNGIANMIVELPPVSESGGASGAFWNDVPGTPTRVSNTQFRIADASNANQYDLMFKKGVLLSWLEAGSWKVALVTDSAYGSSIVTINIVGNLLAAGFTNMKYSVQMAQFAEFYLPGPAPSSALAGFGCFIAPYDIYPISADLHVETAGSGSGSSIVDINDDGSTLFGTKPTITTTGTSDLDNVSSSPVTAVAALSKITADWDSSTLVPPADVHVYLWYIPASWRYRT